MKERQELWCHNCDRYVQFDIDVSISGNHIIECPNCKHEHCRVVENGVVTEARWDSRNASSIYNMTFNLTTSTQSTFTLYNSDNLTTIGNSNYLRYCQWMNTVTSNA